MNKPEYNRKMNSLKRDEERCAEIIDTHEGKLLMIRRRIEGLRCKGWTE